jgi:hypothetical protein
MNKEEVRNPNHGDMTTSRPDKQIKAAWGIEVTVIYFFFRFWKQTHG